MKRVEAVRAECGVSPLRDIVTAAAEAALAAGAILADLYHQPHQVHYKGERDLVTEADVAAEKRILDMLRQRQPQIAVLSEESFSAYGDIPLEPVWVIDPLDGTTNFAHGFPWFAVSIGYMENGKTMAGVIYAPMLDELFLACRGFGAWLNGRRIVVSRCAELKKSLLATGFPYDLEHRAVEVVGALQKLLPSCQGVRRAGAAALDLAYVACGRLEGFWEIELKPWDTAAGLLLVQEAGGMVTDFKGGAYTPFVRELVGSNGLLHDELVARLGQFSSRR